MAHPGIDTTRRRIAEAAARAGRDPRDVTLIAVGKTFDPEVLMEAYEGGQRHFGENRAQELAAKVGEMPGDVNWHFIGPLQRNKVRMVRPAVTLLHSMDRPALADAWLKGPGTPPPVLVEVNIGDEPQKAGVPAGELDRFVEHLAEIGIEVRGLMTIPPRVTTPEEARPYFVEMRRLRDRIVQQHPRAVELSMGMTEDFEVAVEEGATLVRVGRAIFGPRNR